MRAVQSIAIAVVLMGLASLFPAGSAEAVTVFMDSAVSGCQQCGNGAASAPIGQVITPISPVEVTLDAGSYTITNAATSGYYSAWNFSGGWVWSFGISDHATNTVLETGFVAGGSAHPSGIYPNQGEAAGATDVSTFREIAGPTAYALSATSTAGFIDTLTLSQTTTLDFFTLDYYVPDNQGGVALTLTSVQDVPEPEGLAFLCVSALVLRHLSRGARRPCL